MGFGDMFKKTFNDGKDLVKLNMEIDKKRTSILKELLEDYTNTNDINKEKLLESLSELKDMEKSRDGLKDGIKDTLNEGKEELKNKANELKEKAEEMKNKNKKPEDNDKTEK